MVCSGLPRRNGNRHVTEIADFSLHILEETKQFRIPHKPSEKLRIRIGMHTGERWQCGVIARRHCWRRWCGTLYAYIHAHLNTDLVYVCLKFLLSNVVSDEFLQKPYILI